MTKEGILLHLIAEIRSISSMAEELLSISNEIQRDTPLVDLGVNSIDYAEIIYNLSTKWNLNLSVESFVNACRIQEIVDLIYCQISDCEN